MATPPDPPVLVLAVPHLYASLIAECVAEASDYEVFAPNLDEGEWLPEQRYPAVIASVPVPREWGEIIIELPLSFTDPVLVTVGDVTASKQLSAVDPLPEVVALLQQYLHLDIDLDDTSSPRNRPKQ